MGRKRGELSLVRVPFLAGDRNSTQTDSSEKEDYGVTGRGRKFEIV